MKTLLTGKPYTPSHATDLAKTFKRIRAEQKEPEKAQARNVTPIATQKTRKA